MCGFFKNYAIFSLKWRKEFKFLLLYFISFNKHSYMLSSFSVCFYVRVYASGIDFSQRQQMIYIGTTTRQCVYRCSFTL